MGRYYKLPEEEGSNIEYAISSYLVIPQYWNIFLEICHVRECFMCHMINSVNIL